MLANRRLRGPLVGLAALALTLLYTRLVPSGTGAGRGTPAAILFDGLALGMVNALTAVGLILVYRTVRVVNFAQSALGAAGAVMCFNLVAYTKVPYLPALLIGILLSSALGVLFDLIFGRRFFNSPRLVLTTLTIVAATFVGAAAATFIDRLSFFPKLDARPPGGITPQDIANRLPFRGFHFTVGGSAREFGFAHIFAIEVSLVAILAIAAFFRYTRAGVAVRAMAENSERATLLGISTGAMSTVVWAIAGALSGISVILTGTMVSPLAAAGFAPGVLLFGLAAAVVGRMQSIPVAALAAVLFTVANRATSFSLTDDVGLVPVGLFLVVSVGLLLQRRGMLRSEEGAGQTWAATEELRPIPLELREVPAVRWGRRVMVGIGLLAVLVYPFMVSTGAVNLGGVIALNAIVTLSLVVLTGWAGQVSLGQFGFAAIGGVVAGSLSARFSVPFWFAVPIASMVTAGFSALVGIPALRIRGLFLAITTFTFGIAVSQVVFNPRYFGWLLPKNADVNRPTLFFLDFKDEKSMYYLCVACLVVSIVLVVNLRRSRVGRVLIASRENEANLQSFGVTLVRAKLLAFAISGGLAGFSGAVLVHQLQSLASTSGLSTFSPLQNVQAFVLAVVGGITSVGGALLGSAYGNVVQYFFVKNQILLAISGGLPLYVLYVAPGGFIGVITTLRDSVLRIIAQRRQIIVPSLFADYDPDALAQRLVPLAEPLPASGINALRPDQRFAQRSELYRGAGGRVADAVRPGRDKEAAALAAAAESTRGQVSE